MKYLFWVHSHLTFFLTKKIIETDNIPFEDCIFFTTRNYQFPEEYNQKFIAKFTLPFDEYRLFAGFNVFSTFKNYRQLANTLKVNLGNCDFIFYASHSQNDMFSYIVTMKNCKGYYIIEDGVGSYNIKNEAIFKGLRRIIYLVFLRTIFRRIYLYKNRFVSINSPKFRGCIAILNGAFPYYTSYTRVLGIPFEKNKLDFIPDAILSIDNLYRYFNMNEIKMIYTELSQYMSRKNYTTIAYKFHPNFYVNTEMMRNFREIIHQIFSVPLVELDKNVVLENVLMNYKSDFYSYCSAPSIYAHEMGSKIYSYAPILESYNKEMVEHAKKMNPHVFDNFIMIPKQKNV